MLIVKPLTKSECFVSCLVFLKINIQVLKKKFKALNSFKIKTKINFKNK